MSGPERENFKFIIEGHYSTGTLFFFFLSLKFYFMCLRVLTERVQVHRVHAWYSKRTEEGTRSHGTVVMNGNEPPSEC